MNRLEKLRAALPEDFEAALVVDPYNRAYLTGFASSAGWLLITPDAAVLFVDFRYYEAACAKATGVRVVQLENIDRQLEESVRERCAARLYLETQTTLGDYAKLKQALACELIIDDTLTGAIRHMRAVKDSAEIEHIQAAQAITDAAFLEILEEIRPGRTERDIAAELDYRLRKHGADGSAFDTICVAGANTSLPHGAPGAYVIQSGDLVTLDFGARKNGYCSDMTRTVAVGHADDAQRQVYDTVLRAHVAAQHAARAGITGAQLDGVARDIIDEAGYRGCFGHGLGHALGLEIHEEPRANAANQAALRAGTVLTIEPGVYLTGRFGVRIENMVLIEESGCRNLTGSARALIVL